MTDRMSIRLSAFAMAQATVYYFWTLFTFITGSRPIRSMSRFYNTACAFCLAKQPLLFEPDAYNSIHTLYCLKSFLVNARDNPDFFIHSEELEQHLDRVKRLGGVVNKTLPTRIALYEKRAE